MTERLHSAEKMHVAARGSVGTAAVQFDLTQDFPASLGRLWMALGAADYVERKYRSLGSTSLRILKLIASAELIEVVLDRRAPVAREKLPVWARVLSGREQAMHQHTRWRRAGIARVDAEFDIALLNLPVSARGIGSVVELSPRQTRMSLHFDVTSTAPAFKSSLARLFAQQVRDALQADHAFTLDYLRAS
jgi:hypothetical protein